MKKKIVALILTGCMLTATACGKDTAQTSGSNCPNNCGCTDCVCCNTAQDSVTTVDASDILEPESSEQSQTAQEITTEQTTEQNTVMTEETEVQTESQTAEHPNEAASLTDAERAARKQQQEEFAQARELLYSLPNSKDKTTKINQMDKQILANNSYDFSKLNAVFIGDSITEGITAAVDQNGNRVSYVTYTNSYLHFQNVLNHGKGGRMFADYGGEELSLNSNFGNITNVDSNVIIVFAGVNDYLSAPANKRFGDVNDKISTAGYCGAVRAFMSQLQRYYSNNEIFFVTMYNISKTSNCTYSDVTGQLTLNDYMEVQRKLAKEFGFHVIDLYQQGFMDCSTKECSDYYLDDGLHPKDNGNIVLGEHIAAELSLYYSQKQ